MDKPGKSKLIRDIENRLDDFFGGQSAPASPEAHPSSSEAHPSIEKLKSAVLSIDWEITDACLADLNDEAEALMSKFKDDPMTNALLRMLCGLGRYIRKRKAQAHQDAIKRVMSVFTSLELLIEDHQLPERQKKRIVAKEIQAFKKLKEQIDLQKPSPALIAAAAPDQPRPAVPDPAVLERNEFKQAILEVEERISVEVKALKSQLASLQRELDALRKS